MTRPGALFDVPAAAPPAPEPSDLPVNVWLCGQVSSQKQRAGRYTVESNAHPAKMLPEIARRILLTYSRPGDLILDPMAGIGTTMVEAMHLGRRAIGVEFEERFVTMAQGNIDLAAAQGAPGQARVIQGDARDLSGIEAIVDQIAMSPPYGNQVHAHDRQVANRYRDGRVDDGIWELDRDRGSYSADPGNIGNLSGGRYGAVDQIVFSPPYGNRMRDTQDYETRVARMKKQGVKHDPRWNRSRMGAGGFAGLDKMAYSEDAGNIGNLSESRYGCIDEVVFSPPYPNSNIGGGIHERKRRGQPRETDTRIGGCATTLSDDPNNIDNIKSETYLGEMFKVYNQCFQVLRRGGYMVLVTRDFRQDGALVDLAGDTIRLCQAAGFQYCQRIIALLCGVCVEAGKEITPRASFWQICYARAMAAKDEPVQIVQHEDVLVFRKPEASEDAAKSPKRRKTRKPADEL